MVLHPPFRLCVHVKSGVVKYKTSLWCARGPLSSQMKIYLAETLQVTPLTYLKEYCNNAKLTWIVSGLKNTKRIKVAQQ